MQSEILADCKHWYDWLAARSIGSGDIPAVQAYLARIAQLVTSDMVLEACIDAAAAAAGAKTASVRRELKAIQKGDRRAVTSAENGQTGGRPANDYSEAAQHFIRLASLPTGDPESEKTVFAYRYYRNAWRAYRNAAWHEAPETDMEGLICSFCQRHYPDWAETRAVRNIMLNLRTPRTGLVASDMQTPCMLRPNGRHEHAPGLLPMANGIVNIHAALDSFDGEELIPGPDVFMPATPELFALNSMTYHFDPEATCPRWREAVARAFPLPDDQRMFRMVYGLMLVPETRFNVFFIFQGVAGTGKSTYLDVLNRLVGEHNTCTVPLEKFDDDHYTWMLTENLLNSIDDMGSKSMKDVEGKIKLATDGRPMDVRRLYKDGARAPVIARTVAACNLLPRFYERSQAIWDRLRIIPFTERIRGAEDQDSRLGVKLRAELPGIFNWALKGLSELRDLEVFPEHSAGLAEKGKHQSHCDPEGTYLHEHYQLAPECRIESKHIYDHWRDWARANGYRDSTSANLNTAVTRVFGLEKTKYRDHTPGVKTGFIGLGKIAEAFERDTESEGF